MPKFTLPGKRNQVAVDASPVDTSATVGSLHFATPIMTASGTAGYGAELSRYIDLERLAAVVTKSLSPEPWGGNPAPRVAETSAGMINSVGLQGPGVDAWLDDELPKLVATGARVVASIWGRSIDEYARAADKMAAAPPEVVAVEVNISCPNIEDKKRMFSHSASATTEVIEATASCGRPRWAKLSPNLTDIAPIAEAAVAAGAESVTLINTVAGIAIDTSTRRPLLGATRGGLSGPAIKPVALRAVYDTYEAMPGQTIVGVGGIASAEDVVEFVLAGASAVQVGTATFANPRATGRLVDDLVEWCRQNGVKNLSDLIGEAHR